MTDCRHDWRITDTRIDRIHGPDRNPVFFLECRRCGAKKQAHGQVALKGIVNQLPDSMTR